MTVSNDGWFDWASRHEGPAQKTYAGVNTLEFFVGHSMEGWYATGGQSELDRPERQASWHGTILTTGQFMQHYPVFACCWASGNSNINVRGFAIEMEGVAGVPATAAQIATARRIRADLEAFTGRKYAYWPPVPASGYTSPLPPLARPQGRFVQHKEVSTWITPNAGPTACPSDRWDFFVHEIPTAVIQNQEKDDMTPEQKALVDDLKRRQDRMDRIVAGNGIVVNGKTLTGEDALDFLDADGASLAKGQGQLQGDMAKVKDQLALR